MTVEELVDRVEKRLDTIERKLDLTGAPRLFTRKQAADLLGCKLTKLKRMIRQGELRTRQSGGRHLVPLQEIVRHTSLQTSGTPAPKAAKGDSTTAKAERVRAAIRARKAKG